MNNNVTIGVPFQFTCTPFIPAGSALGAGNVPQWAASDSNVALTPSADGLTVNGLVNVGASNFTLKVTGVNADASVAETDTSVTVGQPAAPNVTGFTVAQTQG